MKRKTTSAGLALASVLAVSAAASAYAQQPQSPYYGPHMWSGGWQGWFFGPIMMIVFIAAAVVIVVLLVRWLSVSGHGTTYQARPIGKTPLDILKERFAKGEIDKDEFEERRKLLQE